MKKIILSAVGATVMTVGVYHLALLAGAEPVAAFAVAAVAVATSVAVASVAVAAAFAVIVAVAAAAATNEEQKLMSFRWTIAVYAIEALVIWGALVVGQVGWSIAIVAGGVCALLILWRIAPEPNVAAA